jgi:two-component system LytT family response regulator
LIGISTFEPGDILRVQAQSNYCKIFFIDNGKTVVVSKVLHLLQKQLPPDMFVRVHKSHLVNKQHIRDTTGTSRRIVELTNGESISISRRKLAILHKTQELQKNQNTHSAS